MQKKFEDCVKTILGIIGENPNREGLIKTPNRV
ncbi:GTP cyclohydrolase I, partial [Campylobacter jejuni]